MTKRSAHSGLLIQILLLPSAAPCAAQEAWTATSLTNAPTARSSHTAVWTGSKMIIWGGTRGGYPEVVMNTGGIYDPATDSWTATSLTNAPAARSYHGAVWTGSKIVVWGGADRSGYFSTGGIYDPATNTWTAMSPRNAPTPRTDHTAVWTGAKMIVWGGYNDSGVVAPWLDTGGIYDPATDRWTAMSTANAPTGRAGHTAVWTGSKMIVWGGWGGFDSGGVYDPVTDTWTAPSTTNAPTGLYGHTAVWTGLKMIVWGAFSGVSPPINTGGVYDPVTDTWTAPSTTNAPSARRYHTAAWTGSQMIMWGGVQALHTNTGGTYDPVTDTWTATSTTNTPTPRTDHTAVWTGSKMIVWGGANDSGGVNNTGGVYSSVALLPLSPPPADFYTVTPCRLVDTRNAPGLTGGPALYPGAIRMFPLTGGVCSIPSTATAVSANVTTVGAIAQGNLTVYRGDVTYPSLTSTINFSAGQTRANNAIIPLAANVGTINVRNGSAGWVHLVLDVNGYFQ